MTEARAFQVTLHAEGGASVRFECGAAMSISEAIEVAGLRARLACRGGGCGICVAFLQEGSVRYLQPVSQSKLSACEAQGANPVFLCRAAPETDVVIRVAGATERRNKSPLSALLAPPPATRH